MKFLALGDSYTIGEGVSPRESWPFVLTELLEAQGLELETPEVIATTGWTCDELMAELENKGDKADKADKAGGLELVTLLIGVNDQYRGRSLEQYRAGLVPLIQYATEHAQPLRSGRSPEAGHVSAGGERPERSGQSERPERSGVVLISIPDWSRTPFAEGRDRAAIAREISSYNEVAAEEAARAGCIWADIRSVQDADGDPATLLVADKLHPSASAYEAWANALLPFALAALERA